jgi:hypothetical protein
MTPISVAPAPVATPAANVPGPEPQPPQNQSLWELPPEVVPNIDDLAIQDDKPVDNIRSERNMRLLTEPLHTSWAGPGEGRPFIALRRAILIGSIRIQV